jgi:hypothetical protein
MASKKTSIKLFWRKGEETLTKREYKGLLPGALPSNHPFLK